MCENQNHIVGAIAGKLIHLDAWDEAVTAFEAKIDDFNIRGQREQVNHPGFLTVCTFCPDCGSSLSEIEIRQPDWKS